MVARRLVPINPTELCPLSRDLLSPEHNATQTLLGTFCEQLTVPSTELEMEKWERVTHNIPPQLLLQ